MGIVATDAISFFKGLVLVCLGQAGIFSIVALQAERGRSLLQVFGEFTLGGWARFVSQMARVAAHIQRSVTAAFFRCVQSDRMAAQAKILFLTACHWFEELKLIDTGVGIVTFHAITDGGIVDSTFNIGRVLVRMAGEAERGGSGCNQLDSRYIFAYPDLMTAHASGCDGSVNILAFSLVRVAFDALSGISIFVQWNRMLIGPEAGS